MDLLFNSALALLMFSLGLHLDWKDFHQHIKQPKKLLIGLGTQLILPISITLLLMMIFQLDGVLAMGVLLGAAVPGGTTSGVITHWAKGDTALSVSLTAINSFIITLISLPLVIYYAYDYFLTTDVVNTIHTGQLILQLFLVTIIPLLLSLLFQHIKPNIAHQAQQLSDYYMMVYYITVIVGGIIVLIQDFALFSGNIGTLFLFSFLTNILLLLIGYGIAKLGKLDHTTSKTLAIETSFQNNNLAFALALSVIAVPAVGIPSLFYGLVMTFTGMIIVFVERYRARRQKI